MTASMEASKGDLIRMMGEKICRFANGQPCLCVEKNRPLCTNVKLVALEAFDIAHLGELTREQWNQTQRLTNELEAPKGTKRVRKS